MNTNALLVVLVAAVTILAGSDTLKAEVLTSFEIELDQLLPGQENTLRIMNTGLIQANNAVVLISANGTIADFTNLCAEGQISQLDNSTLVVEFPRMSPYMPCKFKLNVCEPARADITISFDGRILPWINDSPFNHLVMTIVSIIVAMIVCSVIFYRTMRNDDWTAAWGWIDFQIHKGSFVGEVKKDAARTINFVRYEYGRKIDDIDVRVLKLLHYGKTAMGQIKTQSGLTERQINYRLKKLRRLELILPDKMELSKAIQDHFEDDRPKT